MLDRRPVLPGWIMRMTAADRSAGSCFQRDEHRAAPSFDESDAKRTAFRKARCPNVSAGRQRSQYRLHEAARLRELVESDGNPRGDVAFGPNDLDRGELIVGLARQIDSRIEWLAACSCREPQGAESRGESRRQYSRTGEAIPQSRVIVKNAPQLGDLPHDPGDSPGESFSSRRRQVHPSTARNDRSEQIALA